MITQNDGGGSASRRPHVGVLAVAAVSFLVMVGAGFLMAQRIERFHAQNPREIFAFRDLNVREFKYADRPVTLTHEKASPLDQHMILRYGDASERIRVTIPNVESPWRDDLPGLQPFRDWLRVLRMARVTGKQPQQFLDELDAGTAGERLVIVTRIPRAGMDPATWGSVMKKDWQFDFYELMPDGTIQRYERLGYPTTRGIRQPKPGELHENTWQFQAALQLMPQAGQIGPTHNFFGNGISAAGWTLPVAAFAGLVCTLASVFAFAPRRVRGSGKSWRGARA